MDSRDGAFASGAGPRLTPAAVGRRQRSEVMDRGHGRGQGAKTKRVTEVKAGVTAHEDDPLPRQSAGTCVRMLYSYFE